jgi:lipid-binding SYLF domain-containing protein
LVALRRVVGYVKRSLSFSGTAGKKQQQNQSRRCVVTKIIKAVWVALILAFVSSAAWAATDAQTVALFKKAGQSANFFAKSYGYAVFPTIGKGGLGIGGAHGDGHVYVKGKAIGSTSMTQLSIGLQAGGQAYSEIIFFEDKRSLDEFTGGNYEFGAGVNAIAITASASADTGTAGANASASGSKEHASTAAAYYKGVAVFTVAKGGLMVDASVSGQKFKFEATPAK